MTTDVSNGWIAMEALRTVVNRGFDYGSLRVWFTGNEWVEVKYRRGLGHLEILVPSDCIQRDCIEAVRSELVPRVHAALDRQIEQCL